MRTATFPDVRANLARVWTAARGSAGRLAAPLLAIAAWAIVFRGLLAGRALFYSDFTNQYHPLLLWGLRAEAAGRLPAWNPDVLLGLPHLGNPILATFYPPRWLLHLLPITWGLSLLLALHVALAGGAAWWAVRRMGGDRWSGLLAGAAFGLSGALLTSVGYVRTAFAWPWVPVALGGAWWIADAPRRGAAALAIGLAATLLTGGMEATAVAALLAAALGAARAVADRPGATRASGAAVSRRAAWLAAGLALGFGLGAVQAIPALALVDASVRAAGAPGAEAAVWSLAPLRLIGFLNHAFWGRFGPDFSFWGQHLTDGRLGDGNFYFYSHYAGVLPIILAPMALADRARRPVAAVLLAAVAAWLLVAMGNHAPVYGWLRAVAPPLRLVRYPEIWVLGATLGLALLGALGLDALPRASRRARVVAAALALGVVVASAAVLLADRPLRDLVGRHAVVPIVDVARARQRHGAWLGGGVALFAVAVLLSRQAWRRAGPALAVAALVDVAIAHHDLVWTAPAGTLRASRSTVSWLRALGGGDAGTIARHESLNRLLLHVDHVGLVGNALRLRATLRGQAAIEDGMRMVGGETPGRLGHPVPPDEWLWSDPARAAPLLGVRWLLVPASNAPPPVRAATGAGLRPVATAEPLGMAVLAPERPPLPRVFCVDAVRVGDPRALLGDGDPARAAPLEPEGARSLAPALLAALGSGPGGARSCAEWRAEPGRLRATLAAPRATLVVAQDAFAPGWTAEVDGRPAPVVRAYGSLLAVPVAPGAHRLALDYRTPGLRAGAATSAIAVLALAALGAAAVRRRRDRESVGP